VAATGLECERLLVGCIAWLPGEFSRSRAAADQRIPSQVLVCWAEAVYGLVLLSCVHLNIKSIQCSHSCTIQPIISSRYVCLLYAHDLFSCANMTDSWGLEARLWSCWAGGVCMKGAAWSFWRLRWPCSIYGDTASAEVRAFILLELRRAAQTCCERSCQGSEFVFYRTSHPRLLSNNHVNAELQLKSEVYIHLSQRHLNSFNNSWHFNPSKNSLF
jgi:hypothetical protein